MEKYFMILSILGLFATLIGISGIMIQMDKRWDIYLEQEKELRKWLFDSLYSINHKVLLPTEVEKPLGKEKATVYSPSEDGMSEFNGQDEGWFK